MLSTLYICGVTFKYWETLFVGDNFVLHPFRVGHTELPLEFTVMVAPRTMISWVFVRFISGEKALTQCFEMCDNWRESFAKSKKSVL